jgi:hypothetical protein
MHSWNTASALMARANERGSGAFPQTRLELLYTERRHRAAGGDARPQNLLPSLRAGLPRFEFEVVSEAVGGSNRVVSLGAARCEYGACEQGARERLPREPRRPAETCFLPASGRKARARCSTVGTVHSLMAKRRLRQRSCHPGGTRTISRDAVADRNLANIPLPGPYSRIRSEQPQKL